MVPLTTPLHNSTAAVLTLLFCCMYAGHEGSRVVGLHDLGMNDGGFVGAHRHEAAALG
jgi:hypothetical protein